MRRPGIRRAAGQHGQGVVEFAFVLPIFLFLLLIMLEFGLAFNHNLTVGLASRTGARVGAALATGSNADCITDPSGTQLDGQIVAGVQSILEGPGSDIVMNDAALPAGQGIRITIYKADSTGQPVDGTHMDVWDYAGTGLGPDIDPGAGVERIDFTRTSVGWPPCTRISAGATPDSIGVKVRYTYRLQTSLASFVSYMKGNQPATILMNDDTVMVINPTTYLN